MALMPRALFASPLLLLTLVGGHALGQEARNWLDRMNRAVDELNYRGTFVHGGDTPHRASQRRR
jgi:negative regulator of sigma E activity